MPRICMKLGKFQILLNQISLIREERDTGKRLDMLLDLNDSLPRDMRIEMPSLITNAYVRRALDLLEEKISLMAMRWNTMTSSAA